MFWDRRFLFLLWLKQVREMNSLVIGFIILAALLIVSAAMTLMMPVMLPMTGRWMPGTECSAYSRESKERAKFGPLPKTVSIPTREEVDHSAEADESEAQPGSTQSRPEIEESEVPTEYSLQATETDKIKSTEAEKEAAAAAMPPTRAAAKMDPPFWCRCAGWKDGKCGNGGVVAPVMSEARNLEYEDMMEKYGPCARREKATGWACFDANDDMLECPVEK